MKEVRWIDLGLLDYRTAWQQQELLLNQLIADKMAGNATAGYLLTTEHPHVYTLGRNGNEANMLHLQTTQAELIRVDRGGDITYHGPGQLVVYPIFRLDTMAIGIKEYVRRVEEVVICCLADYGIAGTRLDKAAGVWLDAGMPAVRKICAVGVRCSQSVTMHGFALNVNTDLRYFEYINPCGFVNKGVTSLEKETGAIADFDKVKRHILHYFAEVFEISIVKGRE
jgi:lipoyl(octanoyl) transferase